MTIQSSEDQPEAEQAATLVFALVAVAGLMFISVLAVAGAWLGLIIGVVESGIAWRVKPPDNARPLRWLASALGVIVLVSSVARFVHS